jgi:hypothetical protein
MDALKKIDSCSDCEHCFVWAVWARCDLLKRSVYDFYKIIDKHCPLRTREQLEKEWNNKTNSDYLDSMTNIVQNASKLLMGLRKRRRGNMSKVLTIDCCKECKYCNRVWGILAKCDLSLKQLNNINTRIDKFCPLPEYAEKEKDDEADNI